MAAHRTALTQAARDRPPGTHAGCALTLVPHLAAGRGHTAERIAAIEELREFRAAHALAKARWIAGDRDVVFPAGTFWMRVHHRARVAPFP
ncbi:MAG TPA: hypothetical protein VIL20_04190 [Sandaracinaceae bacterium]